MKFKNETLNTLKLLKNINIKLPNIKPFPVNFNQKIDLKKISKINNLIESRFLPDEIKNEMLSYQTFGSYKMDNLYVSIHGNKFEDYFKKQLKFLKVLGCINRYFRKITNKNDEIKISIYLTNFKKHLPDGKIISPININSGFSYIDYNNKRNVIIFREEEWKKLFIHELIHCYNIDKFKHQKIEFINGPDMKYEALTEYLAIILHCQFISYLSKKSFSEILENEIKFFILQSNKLLNFWGFSDITDFYKNKITVNSSPFSYYIFKMELFLNYEKYKDKLDNFILPKLNLNEFAKIPKIKLNDKSLRMSLYDIE